MAQIEHWLPLKLWNVSQNYDWYQISAYNDFIFSIWILRSILMLDDDTIYD